MKTVFVALIFLFDSSTGQPVEVGTAVFETRELCERSLSVISKKVSQDLMTDFQGACVESPVITAN